MTDRELLRIRIPADDLAPGAARRAIDLVVSSLGERIDDARLLASELVTNSIGHGRPLDDGTIELAVTLRAGAPRIEVADGGGTGLPARSSDPSLERVRGRGLQLVSRLASRWGYVWGHGSRVWFELGGSPPAPVDPADALERVDRAVDSADPATVATAACAVLVEIMEHASVEMYRPGPGGAPVIVAAAAAGDPGTPARPPPASAALAAAALGGGRDAIVLEDGRIRVLPVVVDGAPVAALVCSGPAPPYEVPLAILRHIVRVAGRAQQRSVAMRGQQRLVADLRFLAAASEVLSSSLDYEETLQRVARLVVPSRADWCTVNLVEDGRSIRRVAAEHRDPAARHRLGELLDRSPHDPDAPTGVPRVIATGEPLLFEEVPDSLLEETANDPDYLEITRDLAIRSCVIVPLLAHGTVLGTISLVSIDADVLRFDDTDLAVAVDLGRLAGLAIANARRFRDRAVVARALQATLLPEELPAVRGLEAAAAYRPAESGLEIGGDFYDLLLGRDGAWYAVVGDVQGKGPEAATLIGLSRHTVRSAAMRGATPAEALESLNLALLVAPGFRTCTAVCARAQPDEDGSWDLVVARAGHPAPLLCRPGAAPLALDPAGTLLGAFDDPRLSQATATLDPGATLVLYTDGALPRDASSDQRVVAVVSTGGEVGEIAARVVEGADGSDDVAVLVLRGVTPS